MSRNLCVRGFWEILLVIYVVSFAPCGTAAGALLGFSECVIVTPEKLGKVENKAITVLQQEIQKRTSIGLERANRWPKASKPVIAIGLQSQISRFSGPYLSEVRDVVIADKEGFYLVVKNKPQRAVIIIGKDSRGLLYGVGRLLRKMHLTDQKVLVPDGLDILTAPRYPLRGHQLGYRPKTNAYDAWSVAQFDQYIRELAFFGCNSIELVPPRTDDDRTSRHMKVPALQMMILMSKIIDSYGMDVWIWYPNMWKHYNDEGEIKKELEEREEIFKKLKRIDAIWVPSGDPGRLHPNDFFPFMARTAKILQKYHPRAKMWASSQSMEPTREWLETLYCFINQKPSWLGGVVFAPWVKTTLPQMRQIVDKDLPIRRCPDITHNVCCQYPVRDWDIALALTVHRECFNPRPVAMKHIHNMLDEYACGAITYTEGINDDINKFVWGDQDWDPETDVIETLRDYARLFISSEYCEEIAQGIMAQEKNWEGPLATNVQVDVTFQQWHQLEQEVPDKVSGNYRFQMCLLRAYYDAYIKRRLIYETELESEAMDKLRQAAEIGSLVAVGWADRILQKASREPVASDYKKKCEVLADSLFESIGSQLTVQKHGAKHRTRGAFMDGIDEPLNNSGWLLEKFKQVREMEKADERLKAIDKIVNRTNPCPGGFYDNMGSPDCRKRIVNDIKWEDDPGTLFSPRISFYYRHEARYNQYPLAWKNQVTALYEVPLKMAYDNLDSNATYTVKVAYTGERAKKMRLVADHKYQIHDFINSREKSIWEFPIPKKATEDGHLVLTWTCGEGQRASQVAEIWLIKN